MKCALLACLVACGGSSGPPETFTDGHPSDTQADAPAAFALTSPAFAEGTAIPVANSCKGANDSPALHWSNAPAGVMSFAVVLTDKSNNLVHAVIYDIGRDATELPGAIEKAYAPGSVPVHQTLAYDNTTRGYLGPCPPNTHTYQFALVALDTSPLPGATMATTRADAIAAMGPHMLATATLTGTFTP